MGLFYSKRKESQDGKNFRVLRSKPIMQWIFILLLIFSLFLLSILLYFVFTNKSLEFVATCLIVVGSIIFLLFIIHDIEVRPFGVLGPYLRFNSLEYPMLFRKPILPEIVKKGSSLLSFSNPQELWIEDWAWLYKDFGEGKK
jgi:hypothetical protein